MRPALLHASTLVGILIAGCGGPAATPEPAELPDPWTAEFRPPMLLDGPRIHLEPLGPQHAELDHAAFMSSREHLHATLHWGSWPGLDATVEGNRSDLARHAHEFVAGEAYAYTVLTPDRTRCVGCIYMNPGLEEFPGSGPTMALAYWVVADQLESDLDRELLQSVLAWIDAEWPFTTVRVPLHVENERGCDIARALGLQELLEVQDQHRQFVWTR